MRFEIERRVRRYLGLFVLLFGGSAAAGLILTVVMWILHTYWWLVWPTMRFNVAMLIMSVIFMGGLAAKISVEILAEWTRGE